MKNLRILFGSAIILTSLSVDASSRLSTNVDSDSSVTETTLQEIFAEVVTTQALSCGGTTQANRVGLGSANKITEEPSALKELTPAFRKACDDLFNNPATKLEVEEAAKSVAKADLEEKRDLWISEQKCRFESCQKTSKKNPLPEQVQAEIHNYDHYSYSSRKADGSGYIHVCYIYATAACEGAAEVTCRQ